MAQIEIKFTEHVQQSKTVDLPCYRKHTSGTSFYYINSDKKCVRVFPKHCIGISEIDYEYAFYSDTEQSNEKEFNAAFASAYYHLTGIHNTR